MSTRIPATSATPAPGLLPQERMARICKALGHPVRLQIVAFLKSEKKCFCGQIVSRLPLAQSTVSQHLKCLKEAGLVIGQIEGPGTCYCLDDHMLQEFQNSLAQFFHSG